MRFLLASLIWTWSTFSACAFGVVSIVGQASEHEKITRLALNGLGIETATMDQIAGTRSRFGAVGAPDRPDRGLIANPVMHCDGADHLAIDGYPVSSRRARRQLESCRTIIFGALNSAVAAAEAITDGSGTVVPSEVPVVGQCTFNGRSGRAKCDVLEHLGIAFHAAQDFYAHTNWVDKPRNGPVGPENPPGLGNSGPAKWLDPAANVSFPEGLISGCFQGLPERSKCFYLDRKERIRHSVLNKDTGRINMRTGRIGRGTTSRGIIHGNFRRAVEAAIADTRNKWLYFEAQVLKRYGLERGAVILCAVKRDREQSCSR
jgi:hypothetical protein